MSSRDVIHLNEWTSISRYALDIIFVRYRCFSKICTTL